MFSTIWAQHGSAPAMRIGGVAASALRLALGPWAWPRGLDVVRNLEGTEDIRFPDINSKLQPVSANSELITCDNMVTIALRSWRSHRPYGLKPRIKCAILGYLSKTQDLSCGPVVRCRRSNHGVVLFF